MADNKVICGCDVMTQGHVVPFEILNEEQKRSSKEKMKLTTIILVLLMAFVLTNVMWIYYFNQYDYEVTTETVTQDGDGINNYNSEIGGDCVNGSENSKNN